MELKPCCQFALFLDLQVSDWVFHVASVHGGDELDAMYAANGGEGAVKEASLAAKAGKEAGVDDLKAGKEAGVDDLKASKEAGVDDFKAGKEAGKKKDAAAEVTGEDASKEEEVVEREDASEEEEVPTGGFWTSDQDDAFEDEQRENILRMREEEKWEREAEEENFVEAKIAKKAQVALTAEQELQRAKWEAERARWKAESDKVDRKKAREEVAARDRSAARLDAALAELKKDQRRKERAKARAAARGQEYIDSSDEDNKAYSGPPNDSDSGSGSGNGGTYLVHDFED